MLTKNVNGVKVELSAEEEAKIRAEWAANDLIHAQDIIRQAKTHRKSELIREKVESLIAAELAEVDAATTVSDIKKVKIK